MSRAIGPLAACLLLALVTGCTSVGFHNRDARQRLDFGAADRVALCVLVDDGISEQRARTLVEEAWRDEAPLYGLRVDVVSVTPWRRPAFAIDGIIDALRREPLKPGCDRILALIGRHLGDVVWGLLPLPEYLGAVNDETLTHGYVIARRASLNQLFESPRSVVRHELYHLLGCDQHFKMARCYEQIAALKRWKQAHGSDFFPAWDLVHKRMLLTRDAVNERLREVTTGVSGSLAAQ
jgi:hypothetical protein